MTAADYVAQLRSRRTALWEQGRTFTTPTARAAIAREIRLVDAQIAAYEAAAERLAELDELSRRLAARPDLAQRLTGDGIDWPQLFRQLRRAALGDIPWSVQATQVLARLRNRLEERVRERAIVAHVIDGDSIRLADGREVRYIGIDTPEMHNVYGEREPMAQEATDANARLVAGKEVRLEQEVSEADCHGRLLRHVYAGTIWVNGELVRLGLATALCVPPDVREAARLKALQESASCHQRGIWAP